MRKLNFNKKKGENYEIIKNFDPASDLFVGGTRFLHRTAKISKTMGIVRDAAKSNKKALIAVNLQLTEAEEKGFWPLYDSYQADLEKIQERQLNLIKDYAKDYNANSLTDEKAKKLMADYMATEEDTLKLNKSYFSKFDKVLPGKKVMAY